jgi:hypothetical protein
MTFVPHYDLTSARLATTSDTRVVYRPTPRTALLYSQISVVCLVGVVIVQVLIPSAWIVSVLLLGLAAYAPLSCFWDRLAIERTAGGDLVVSTRTFLPRRRRWPRGELAAVQIWAMERYRFPRRSAPLHDWEWIVRIGPCGTDLMPVGRLASANDDFGGPEFTIFRQADAPRLEEPLPERVRRFVDAVAAVAGVPVEPVQIVPAKLTRGPWGMRQAVRSSTHTITWPVSETRTTRTFRSLADMPPELRQQVAQMLQSGEVTRKPDGTMEVVSRQITRCETLEGPELDAQLESLPREIRDEIRRRLDK